MKNQDIQNVMFANQEVESMYLGSTLVWQRQAMIKGKFKDNSTEANWWYTQLREGSTYLTDKIDITEYVNPETKEFSFVKESPSLKFLFRYNNYLESISSLPITSICTDMASLFNACTSLQSVNFGKVDVSKVEDMSSFFYDCDSLTELDLSNWNTDSLTNLQSAFASCEKLQTLKLANWNTSKVSNIGGLLSSNGSLITLDISNWDFNSVTGFGSVFTFCNNLTNVIGPVSNIKESIDLSNCPLTNESAMTFINGLAIVGSTRNLRLKAETYDTLKPEQIAIATNRGWTIERS